MKFKINTDILKTALKDMAKIGRRSNTASIKIEAESNWLKLETANDIQSITTVLPVQTETTGIQFTNILLLAELMNKMESKETVFEKTGNVINIKNGKTNINIPCLSEGTVVTFENGQIKETVKTDHKKFAVLLEKAQPFCSKDKQILKAVNITFNDNLIKANASDSYTGITAETDAQTTGKAQFNLPCESAQIISQFNGKTATIEITTNNIMVYRTENIIFKTCLIAGNFPSLEKITANREETNLKINKNTFEPVLDRISCLNAGNNTSATPLKFIIKNGELEITLKSELGSINEKIECESNINTTIAFSCENLKRIVKNTKEGEFEFNIKSPLTPVIINMQGTKYIVAPVRAVPDSTQKFTQAS